MPGVTTVSAADDLTGSAPAGHLHSRRALLGACLGLAGLPAWPAPPGAAALLLTMLDGTAFLLRGSDKFALAEGVPLQADDIVDVPAGSHLARLEWADGPSLALGPGSRVLVAPRLAGERAGACIYLLAGWAKLTAPANVKSSMLAPMFDVATSGGTLVLAVQPTASLLFVEAGAAVLRRNGAAPQALKTGELLSLAANAAAGDGAKPDITNRPTPAFVAALPRAFMDLLPLRAARFRDHPIAPRRLGPLVYADAQPWIDAEPALRRANLPRWRSLARDAEFRRGLLAGLKAHPEWGPILMPPPSTSSSMPAPAQPTRPTY